MANKDALKVAVIGGGHIAQQHLPVLRDLLEAALVSLVEKQPQTLQETADRFAIPRRFSSHIELLERDRPDAVFVLISVLQVAAVAAACIRAGVPTFMEKPPGLCTGQTRELAALVRRHQTPAMVGVNRRFYSTLLQGRQQLLANGPVRSVVVEVHEDISRLRSDPPVCRQIPRGSRAALECGQQCARPGYAAVFWRRCNKRRNTASHRGRARAGLLYGGDGV